MGKGLTGGGLPGAGPQGADPLSVEEGARRAERSPAKRLKGLEQENAQFKRLMADLALDNSILKEVAAGHMIRTGSNSTYGYRPPGSVHCLPAADVCPTYRAVSLTKGGGSF